MTPDRLAPLGIGNHTHSQMREFTSLAINTLQHPQFARMFVEKYCTLR